MKLTKSKLKQIIKEAFSEDKKAGWEMFLALEHLTFEPQFSTSDLEQKEGNSFQLTVKYIYDIDYEGDRKFRLKIQPDLTSSDPGTQVISGLSPKEIQNLILKNHPQDLK